MLFSVIVPMYNVEKYARQCIESILNQTYKDFELILVNDGSKDSTPQIIDEYAAKDNRIVAVHKENGGLVSARKAGLLKSSGEYICPVDGDDWVDIKYLEKFAEIIKQNSGIALVCCECISVSDDGNKTDNNWYKEYGYFSREEIERKIVADLFWFSYNIWAKTFRKDIYEGIQLMVNDVIGIGEDMAVVLPYITRIESMYILPDRLHFYRYNPQSMTRNKKKEFSADGLIERIKLIENLIPLVKYNLEDKFIARVAHDTFNVVLSYFRANSYKVAKQKSNVLLEHSIIKKYVNKKGKIDNKKEILAKIALKYRLFFVIKVYSLIY